MRQQPDDLRIAVQKGHYAPSLLEKLANRRLRTAFLRITRSLPAGRASVLGWKSAFDNAARDECPINPKGQELRDCLRSVMTAAVRTNDQLTIDAARADVEAYLSLIAEQVFSVIPGFDASAFASATVDATRETSEFVAAAAEAGTTRNASAIERARREGLEARHAIEAFDDAAGRILHGVA